MFEGDDVVITILIGITLVGSYFYSCGFGWKVSSNDLKVTYCVKDDIINFDFELINGRYIGVDE